MKEKELRSQGLRERCKEMRNGLGHLTKVVHETNKSSLEEVPKAQLWKLFQIRCHMYQTKDLDEG